MLLKTFAVRDIKSETFSHVNNFKRIEEAMRAFCIACDNTESDWFKYAEDYALFEIGNFDDEKGLHIPFTQPKLVLTALNASSRHKDYYASKSLPEAVNS